MDKKKIKKISFIIFIAAMLVITVLLIPLVMSLKDNNVLKEFIERFGPFGIVVVFIMQIIQIVVALIPGEIIEFVSGALYGWLGGLLICLAGVVVGEFIVFKIVRVLGSDFVEKVAGSEKLKKFKFLQNEKKLETLVFFLYFIPGTPKDLLTYIVPLTKIKLRDFLVISTFARVFSIVSSTYAGDLFTEKNYVQLAVVYGIIIIVSVAGILINKLIEKKRFKE